MSEILAVIRVWTDGLVEHLDGDEVAVKGKNRGADVGTFENMLDFNPDFKFGDPPKLIGLPGWQNRDQDPLRGGAYVIPKNSKIYYSSPSQRYYLKGYSPVGFWHGGKQEFVFMKLPQVPPRRPDIDNRPEIDGSKVARAI